MVLHSGLQDANIKGQTSVFFHRTHIVTHIGLEEPKNTKRTPTPHMRRSVAEATIYEYGKVRHREDISWVLTQNSSFKLTIHEFENKDK